MSCIPSRAVRRAAAALLLSIGSLLIPGSEAAAQAVACDVFVRSDADDAAADGRSWSTAYATVEAAMQSVDMPVAPTNVCVAAGVYRLGASLDLRDGVHLYGGFAGEETSTYHLPDRDLAANVTVLDGSTDHVLRCRADACSGPITLDGFTIRGGAAGMHGSPSMSGGGLYNAIGELSLANVIFSQNTAEHQGGAVFNVAGTLRLANVVFDGNASGHEGGAIYNHAGKLYLSNVVLHGNTSAMAGGGLYTLGETEIANSIFLDNASPYGSAAVGGHWFILTNSIVWSNPRSQGGQIFVNPALAKVGFSIVEDNGTANNIAYAGTSNTDSDPSFVDAFDPDGPDGRWGTADDGLMLREDSPAIDAGTREGVELADRDLIGNPRVRGASVDTGPYEFAPAGSVAASRGDVVDAFVLDQNYPNPFNPQTTIGFTLPTMAEARLVVYDLLGHEVRVLLHRTLSAGTHDVHFDATGLPSGVYTYVLFSGDRMMQRDMVLLR